MSDVWLDDLANGTYVSEYTWTLSQLAAIEYGPMVRVNDLAGTQ